MASDREVERRRWERLCVLAGYNAGVPCAIFSAGGSQYAVRRSEEALSRLIAEIGQARAMTEPSEAMELARKIIAEEGIVAANAKIDDAIRRQEFLEAAELRDQLCEKLGRPKGKRVANPPIEDRIYTLARALVAAHEEIAKLRLDQGQPFRVGGEPA